MSALRTLSLGFAGNRLVRDGENRTAETLGRALADPGALVYLMHEGRWLVRSHAGGADPGFDVATASELAGDSDFILLGHDLGGLGPRLAARAQILPPEETGIRAEPLRALATGGLLDADRIDRKSVV